MSGDRPRYRRVSIQIWSDEKFVALSPPRPSARYLLLWLLTGPLSTAMPGLIAAGTGTMADRLHWPLTATRRVFRELLDQEIAEYDPDAPLIWLPNAVKHNMPDSPNVVAAWRRAVVNVPACPLKDRALTAVEGVLEAKGRVWLNVWQMGPGVDGARLGPRRLDSQLRAAIKTRDDGRCRYCGVEVDWRDRRGPRGATYDHLHPNGPESLENIVLACRGCNAKKGRRTPE